jgi:O-antigen/teichoic acid export membrane protein
MTSKVSRDLMIVTGGRVATVLMGLISLRVVTTILAPEQYGALALLIVVQTFCGLLIMNPVGQHINLHTHAWWDDGTILARLKWYRRYVLVGSFVGGMVVLFLSKPHSTEESLWAAGVIFSMIFAGTWNATLVSMLNMLGFRGSSVFWGVVTQATGLSFSVILSMWSPTAVTWVAGQAVGMAVGSLGARYMLRKRAVEPRSFQGVLPLLDRKTFITYCMPLAFATGLMWLQMSGYRVVIESYWGLAQLGFLAVGLQLAGQFFSLSEALAMQFFFPLFFLRVGEYENEHEVELAVSDLMNTLAPVYLVITGLVVLGAPYFLKLLVAPQFHEATYFVMLGAGIELCRVIGNLLSNAAHVRRQTKSLASPYGAGAGVSLVLIYLAGVNHMGIIWAVVALIAGSMVMLIVMWVAMRRRVRFTLDTERWVWGTAIMLAMVFLASWIPTVQSLGASIAMLAAAAIPVSVAIFALLWKNPAMFRLLNVQLREK